MSRICSSLRIWKRNYFGFFKVHMKNKFSMHKLQIYVSESIMNSNDNGFLFHPHQMFVFSSGFDIYLPSSKKGKISDDKWVLPAVLFVCRNLVEYSKTPIQLFVVLLMVLHTQEMIIENSSVRFFGTSAEVERCPLVNTVRAHHR